MAQIKIRGLYGAALVQGAPRHFIMDMGVQVLVQCYPVMSIIRVRELAYFRGTVDTPRIPTVQLRRVVSELLVQSSNRFQIGAVVSQSLYRRQEQPDLIHTDAVGLYEYTPPAKITYVMHSAVVARAPRFGVDVLQAHALTDGGDKRIRVETMGVNVLTDVNTSATIETFVGYALSSTPNIGAHSVGAQVVQSWPVPGDVLSTPSTELFLRMINTKATPALTAGDIRIRPPAAVDPAASGGHNTEVIIEGSGARYRGPVVVKYNRVLLTEVLLPYKLQKPHGLDIPADIMLSVLLPVINRRYGLALTADDVADVVVPARSVLIPLTTVDTSYVYRPGPTIVLGTTAV